MRHPFDGILLPETEQTDESRREALKQFVAGGAIVLGLTDSQLPADEKPAASPRKRAAVRGGYSRYLVVPRDFRSLKGNRREKLGIGGGYFRCAMHKDDKLPRAGFLAWLTKDAAKKLAGEKHVREVVPIKPADIPGPGSRPPGVSQLAVQLVPNGFAKLKPPKDSFVDTPTLIDKWTKAFPAVKFKPSGSAGTVLINIGPAGMPESLPKDLKKHPQVAGVQWHATATTLAVAEEGATTKSLGEEAASTRRRGEEGGPTTLAIGEEGASTKRRGEEGGVSTRRGGEEGGIRR